MKRQCHQEISFKRTMPQIYMHIGGVIVLVSAIIWSCSSIDLALNLHVYRWLTMHFKFHAL